MSKRQSAWLAAVLGAGLAGLLLWGQLLILLAPGTPRDFWSIANSLLNAMFPMAFGIVGVIILAAARQWRNVIGWLLLVSAFSFELSAIGQDYWQLTVTIPLAPTTANLFFIWLNQWVWWLLIGPLALILLVFPTGRLLTRRWRVVVAALVICFITFLIQATFTSVLTDSNTGQSLPNPLGLLPQALANWVLIPWEALMILTVISCVSAVFVRYRRAGPTEREQIKWFFFACSVFLLVFCGAAIGQVLGQTSGVNAFSVVFDLAILFIPISIGIAILRYRLYDIDVIIRRTLIYAVLTALLALAYFGSVLVLQAAFGALTGQSQSPLATVLSTLVIAALFVPLRRRVQAVIDRRLFRRKYDAAQTLAVFGAGLRDSVDLDALTEQLLATVDETMQPATVELWLK